MTDDGSSAVSRWILLVTIPSLAVLAASAVLGGAFVLGRSTPGVVRVVGAATVPFTSDVVKWRVTLKRSAAVGGEVAGYARLAEDRARFLAGLQDAGVAREDISVQPVTTSPRFNRDGAETGVDVRQSFLVVSHDLDAVEALALDPGPLVRDGLALEGSTLEYFYDDMATLKRSLLRTAREDAGARAEEIAGDRLGDLVEARAGVFQIREPYSTEVQGYGMYSTATRDKEMTVTVHAVFAVR